MKYSVKKLTAWILTLMMLLSSMPVDALASIGTIRQENEIIDISDAVQVYGDLVTNKVTSRDGFSVKVESAKKDLPVNGEVKFRTLRTAKAVAPVADGGRRELGSYDISIWNDDLGEEWQPEAGETVDVTVSLPAPLDVNKGEKLYLIHDPEGKNEDVHATFYVKNEQVTGFSFKATGFSVYAVVAAPDPDALLRVVFKDGEGADMAEMYVKAADAEKINQVIYDPSSNLELAEGVIFAGWTDTADYTADVSALSIEQVRTEVLDMLPPAEDGQTVVYYPVLIKQYTINYLDPNDASLGVQTIVLRADDDTPQSFTIDKDFNPLDDVHDFEGWVAFDEETKANIVGYAAANEPYQFGDTLETTGNVTFKVEYPEGHWLVFDENGKGGTYNAPQFLHSDTDLSTVSYLEMKRRGYTFDGWYTGKPTAEGEDPTGDRFTFSGLLTEKTTIYAKWKPNTNALYTVIFWKKGLNGTYEVGGSYVKTNATVGQNIPYSWVDNGDEDYAVSDDFGNSFGHFKGFCLTDDSKGQTVKITPEGDAVLNLYYDRIRYNFKFYLYRQSNNGYNYGNNSDNGRTLDDLVTWHSSNNNHPSVTGHTIQSEQHRFGNTNYTYYYFTISALYGENISNLWPTYSEISGVGNNAPVSYVMMVGTELKPNPTNTGSGTVKGTITIMDESILGNTSDANGNYVIIRFNTYNNWRYHIWYETIDGVDYSGYETHTYNGKTYYEDTVMEVRSSNLEVSSQNAMQFPGYDFQFKKGSNWDANTVRYWETTQGNTTLYHLNYIYNRKVFPITYFDGNYVDGYDETNQNRADKDPLWTSPNIGQGTTIADEYRNYVPDLPDGENGYAFEGWYMDKACTSKYTWSTMPIGGITVYAKWRQIEYRVFQHLEGPADGVEVDWGEDDPPTDFRKAYGSYVSPNTGIADGYAFVGWYREDGTLFNAEATALTDTTVVQDYPESEKLSTDKPRWWITRKLDLYPKWREVLEGADGIRVQYSLIDPDLDGEGNPGEGTGTAVDGNMYVDTASANAVPGVNAPDGYQFAYWVMQKYNINSGAYEDVTPIKPIYAGQAYTVLATNAKDVPVEINGEPVYLSYIDDDGIVQYLDENGKTIDQTQDNWQSLLVEKHEYVIQLRAEYSPIGQPTPTHISWFLNNGEGVYHSDTTAGEDNHPLIINEAVDILDAPARDGYQFLGWAFVQEGNDSAAWEADSANWTQDLTEPDIYYQGGKYYKKGTTTEVTQVAADENLPYDAVFAVWLKEIEVSITGSEETKTYNGQKQSNTTYTVTYKIAGETATEADLPTGITASITAVQDGATADPVGASGTNVGDYTATVMVTLSGSATGYVIKTGTASDDVVLHITPATLTITAGSDSKVYDGTALTKDTYTNTTLATGDTIDSVTVTGSQTEVGTSNNVPSAAVIRNATGDDVTSNYTITYANGTLEVTKKPLTITADSDSKVYDGTALTKDSYTNTALAEGDTIDSVTVTGSQTEVGTSDNVPSAAVIKNAAGTDVTKNYDITYTNGTLEVTKKALTITADSDSKVYDGTALTKDSYTNTDLASGDTIDSVTVTGSQTEVGTSDNVPSAAVIKNAAGTDVTKNYAITYTNGTLEVTKKALTITADSDSKVYDGTALTKDSYTNTALAEGDTIDSVTVTGSQTDVGTSDNVPSAAVIKNAAGTDVTKNYDITYANGTLEVTKKTLTITADNDSKVYDGTALTKDSYTNTALAEGDTIDSVTVTGSQTDVGTSDNVPSAAVIKNAAGTDVTKNYDITYANGTLEVTKKTLTITADNDSKVYDGTALTKNSYTNTDLAAGDTIDSVTVTGSQTDVGTSNNVPSAAVIKNATGTDVTKNYDITYANGTLEVTKRKVTLTSATDSKTYDGTPLTNSNVTVSGDGFVEGEGATYNVTGTITDPGTEDNTFTYSLNEGTKADNYDIKTVEGKLTITKITTEIVITAASDDKMYDGKALTNDGYTYTEGVLAEGDVLTAVVEGTITDVGTADNVVTSYKVMRGETDVTTNYTFGESVNGTLEVTKRTVTLTSGTASKTYDGTPLTNDEVTVSGDGFVEGEGATYNVTGTITDPGTEDNTFTYSLNEGTKADNYDIKTVEGKLTITKITTEIVITAASDDKMYDGKALTNDGYTYTEGVLAEGDVLTAVVEGTITDVGTADNVVTSYKVMRGETDVTTNYTFGESVNGTLEVTKRTVTLTSGTASKTYDGTPLTNDEVTVSGDGFVEGEGATYNVTGTITDPGTEDNTFTYSLNEGTKADNYDIKTVEGKLTITKITTEIVITAASDDKMYDGKALTNDGYTYTEGVLAEGDVLTAVVEGTITDVGTADNVVTSYKVMRGETDVTTNYTFGESVNGTLEVTKRTVTLTSGTASKTYDGTPLTNSNVTVSGDGFVEGEGATYNVTGTITDPGTEDNTFTYSLNEGTKADNYDIKTVEGKLTITKITTEIVITAASDDKMYDGKALTNDGYTYTEGVLAEGDVLTAVVEGTITDVGTADNVVTSYKVMRGETDVTTNYTFGESVNGTLEVTKRTVTLTSGTASKTYDGTPLTNSNVTVSGDGFVEGEGATYNVTGTITDPGTEDNTFTYSLNEGTKADNYDIKTVEGKLTITKITTEIVITAASDDKMYDGKALTNDGYTYTEGVLAEGDVLTVVVEGTITDVGTADNVVTSYKVMRGETDVTTNYTFGESVNGTLEVTKRTVTLTSGTASKTYDGTPLTNDEVTVSGDGFVEGEGATYNVTGTITDPGTEDNTFTYSLNEGTKADNYDIKTVEGKLTITKITTEIVITAASDDKMYDGKALTNDGYTYTEGVLAEGDVLTAVVEGTITDVGTADNVVTSYKVMRGETDVTTNYTFGESVNGTLEVTKRTVTLTSGTASKTYDGTPLTNDEVTVSGDGFVEGEGATYNVTGTITDPGTEDNTFTYSLNEGTKADNYDIKTVEGKLTITKITTEIVITAASDDKMYDGTALTNDGYTYTEGVLAEGDVLTAVVEGTITDVGTADNVVTSYKVMRGETDVTTNYTFGDSVNGTLEVTKRTVTLTSETASKTYDGTPLTKPNVAVTGDGFVEGEVTDIKATGSVTTVAEGEVTNTITYTEGTNFKADNYAITKNEGKLKINPITDKVTVTITENSDEVTYDGQAHTIKGYKTMTANNDLYDVETSVKATETADWTVTKTDAGTYDMGILATDFENTNTNFTNVEFVIVDGKLIINPISDKVTVTITENSDEVTYDGQAHTIKGYKTMTADNDLYDTATSVKATETADWTVTKTDAGTYDMGIVPGDFENTNKNFTNVEFEIVDGKLIINPISEKVTVTITENSDEVTYDGQAHTIKGYKTMTADNDLYDTATSVKATETADWTVTKTDAGTYDMGIVPGDFENTNKNFTNVEFEIVDGKLIINPISEKVTVTITENSDEVTYDGQEHTIKGYKTMTADNDLYDVTTSVKATETADWTVTKTDAGTYDMGIVPGDFENTNKNFTNVEFEIVDGKLIINPISDKVTVTITENSGSEKYDGTEKTVTGYEVTNISNTLYKETDFTFGGDATVKGTDAGSYDMELKPADFTNISTNFTNVEFKIVDGTLEISKRTVIMTSATDTKVYDSTPLTNDEVKETGDGFVDGEGADYDVTGSQTLVGESENTFTYTLKDGTKADNYTITTVFGKLTVTDEGVPDDLVVKKTADDTVYALGDEVTFDIWVKNIYDDTVTIKLIEIEGVTLAKDTFEGVEPGAEITTTATYTITEADILAGSFTNTVTAKVVEKEWSAKADVKVEEPNASLKVTKKTTSTPADGKAYVLDETITYEITVENDGNLTLTDVTVVDEKTGDKWTVESLAPGATETFTAEYVVTEADVLAGSVKNDVTATGNPPDDDIPDPEDDDEVEDPTEEPKASLKVTKETTSTPADGKAYVLDEKITYKITVKNDGNLTLTNVVVTDELTGDEWTIDTMKPGETKEFEAEYIVTEADVLAGSVKNSVTAKGNPPDDDIPDPEEEDEVEDPTEDPNGHITIEKVTTSKSANPKGYVEGETITYKITVKNDGNLTITEITVTDALTGDEWKIDSMVPGEEKEYETSYTVTAKDVEAGEVLNVATGTGKSPDPKNPDVPVTPGEDPEPTTEDKYTLTIEYIYQDGRTAAATHTEVLHAGDAYDVQSPYIAGYYASQQKVTGTMPARDVMVTVIYLEPRNTITIDDFVTPLGIGLGSMNAGETIE